MAIGPPSSNRNNPLQTPISTPIVTSRILPPASVTTPVCTPRYHTDFQDFLNDFDAEYYNPLPQNWAFV